MQIVIELSEKDYQSTMNGHIPYSVMEALCNGTVLRKGKWTNNQNGTYECDKCGCKHSRSKYCPNCGAKMFEPQESEVRNDLSAEC